MNANIIKKEYLSKISLENWLCLSIFLLPSYLIKITFFVFPTNVLEIMIAVGFFWWLLDKKYSVTFKNIWEKYGLYFLPLGLIFFGLIMGIVVGGNYRTGLGIIKGWFVFPIIFSFILSEVLGFQQIKKIFQCFFLSATIVAVIALGYWILGQVTFDFRLKAIFNSPNYLAMYLSPAMIVGIVLFKEKKIFYFLSLILILLTIFFTHSFAAWVAILISLMAIVCLTKQVSKKNIFGVALISLLIVLSFSVVMLKNEKMQGILSFNERSSLSSRLMIWTTANRLIQDNIFWGIGPGNFQNKYLEYQKFYPPYLEWAVPHPHNIFLAFWLFSGFFGLLGFLFLLGIFFWEFLKKQKNALGIMAFGIMLVIIVQGLIDTTYFKNDLAVIFWLTYMVMVKKL